MFSHFVSFFKMTMFSWVSAIWLGLVWLGLLLQMFLRRSSSGLIWQTFFTHFTTNRMSTCSWLQQTSLKSAIWEAENAEKSDSCVVPKSDFRYLPKANDLLTYILSNTLEAYLLYSALRAPKALYKWNPLLLLLLLHHLVLVFKLRCVSPASPSAGHGDDKCSAFYCLH